MKEGKSLSISQINMSGFQHSKLCKTQSLSPVPNPVLRAFAFTGQQQEPVAG